MSMKPDPRRPITYRLNILCLAALLPLTTADAVDLSQVPLYLTTAARPNIFILHDDSDSMDSETLIDDTPNEGALGKEGVEGADFDHSNVAGINPLNPKVHHPPSSNGVQFPDIDYFRVLQIPNPDLDLMKFAAAEEEWRVRFHEINPLYYNPKIKYLPWPDPTPGDGATPYKDMTLEAALIEAGDGSTATLNLTLDSAILYEVNGQPRRYYNHPNWPAWCHTHTPANEARCRDGGWRYYYRDTPGGPVNLKWVTELTGAERTNFANWFTYHRSRKNVAKYAIGTAVSNTSGKRLGYGAINDIDKGTTNDIAAIADNNNSTVLNKLYATQGNGSTPLQKSLNWVGKYYEGTATGFTSPILSQDKGGACQLNSTLLITDGFYNNGSSINTFAGIGNTDGDNNSAFDGDPYADTFSNTLGDIAMHYYERDLATTLPNAVKPRPGDGATHQHVNTYTISLGLEGYISNPGSLDFSTLESYSWTDPMTSVNIGSANKQARIDDLFHAAVNGRGAYFLASNPNSLITAINNIVTSSGAPSNSSNTIATSSFRLDTSSLAITTSFDPAHWSGTVTALRVNGDGTLNETTPAWSSDTTLPFGAERNIITYDGGVGMPFRWANIAGTGLEALLDSNAAYAQLRLNYLRGQKVADPDPTDNITFRDRSVVLGDIVNSSPVSVGAPSLLYPDADPFGVAANRYSKFWKAHKERTPMVYVGANDGMLHGFRMSDGVELLAYAPRATFDRLKNITDPAFDAAHQYFVDQTPTISDVYIKTSLETEAWRTVLVNGLGAGGRGLFALDVTNPASFSEANASKIALWEFTNADDSDLGYTLAKPVIAMTENNKWVAITGNGDGSDSGKAVLFILDLDADASDGWTLDSEYTKIGTNDQTGNALFSPAAVDSDGNGKVDHVYAGDLLGNLWVFDLSNNSSKILFKAADSNGKAQPITSKPTVVKHPTQPTRSSNRPNMMVLFGTGRYLNKTDLGNSDGQSFYAVWDDGQGNNMTRSSLATQSFLEGHDAANDIDARLTHDIHIDYSATDGTKKYGWYLDLDNPATAPSERVVTSASVYQGIVFFTTYIPTNDPCEGGGESWFMFLKSYNGGPPDKPIISINNNRLVEDQLDLVNLDGTKKSPSGLKIEGGAFGLRLTQGSIIIGTPDKGGETTNLAHNLGATANLGKRISWRELRRE